MRFVLFIITAILLAAIVTLVAAVMVGCVNSWVMQDTFANGWAAAIDRWYITLGVGILFGGITPTLTNK